MQQIESSGVQYRVIAGTDFKAFRCEPHQAVLTIKACAGMHVRAQSARDDELDRVRPCRSCSIGADHAGRRLTYFSRLYGTEICPRCGQGTTRMIDNRRCVCCYNREREVLAGRNSKGTRPVSLRPVFQKTLRYHVDGASMRTRAYLVTGTTEIVANTLRTVPGRAVFQFQGDQSRLSHGRLL